MFNLIAVIALILLSGLVYALAGLSATVLFIIMGLIAWKLSLSYMERAANMRDIPLAISVYDQEGNWHNVADITKSVRMYRRDQFRRGTDTGLFKPTSHPSYLSISSALEQLRKRGALKKMSSGYEPTARITYQLVTSNIPS